MKKLKIITLNIFIVVILLLLAESICFIKDYKGSIYKSKHTKFGVETKFPPNWTKTYKYEEQPYDLRKPTGLEYKNAPIIIFGCSFAYGDRLKDNQTFSYKLSKLVKAPVYNRAACGWGLQNMFHQIRTKEIFNVVKQKPQQVIYVLMYDHIYRMYRHTYAFPFNNMLFLQYKFKKNDFVKYDPKIPFLERLSLSGIFYNHFARENAKNPKYFDKNFNLMKQYFIKSKNELEAKYGKINFAIVKYEFEETYENVYLKTERWKELEDAGFTVLDTTELMGRKLNKPEDYADDGFHPSEKVWDNLTPIIAKKLNLIK